MALDWSKCAAVESVPGAVRRDEGTGYGSIGICNPESCGTSPPIMLILFDHGTPRGLARALHGHTLKEARAQGWDTLAMATY